MHSRVTRCTNKQVIKQFYFVFWALSGLHPILTVTDLICLSPQQYTHTISEFVNINKNMYNEKRNYRREQTQDKYIIQYDLKTYVHTKGES